MSLPIKVYHGQTNLRRALLVAVSIAGCALPAVVGAQQIAAWEATANPASEPIHWKQNLFLIPYQWGTSADPNSAHAVWLYVSKDVGTTWDKISEAKPNVRAFNYHAEADGEYWFAIRTLDHYGRAWPAGPLQPELRVVVDTTMPRFEQLHAYVRDDGLLEIQWRARDPHLDAASMRVEVQTDGSQDWHATTAARAVPANDGTSAGQTTWKPPAGSRPVAVRATVSDQAGNPAFYQAEVSTSPASQIAQVAQPAPTLTGDRGGLPSAPYSQASTPTQDAFRYPPLASTAVPSESPSPSAYPDTTANSGWTAPSASPPAPAPQSTASISSQPWPADATARSPFRVAAAAGDLQPAEEGTTYGTPLGIGGRYSYPSTDRHSAGSGNGGGLSDTSDMVAVPEDRRQSTDAPKPPASLSPQAPDAYAYTPLEPFREAAMSRPMPVDAGPTEQQESPPLRTKADSAPVAAWADRWSGELPPGARPRLVNSRSFALEYEVNDVGGWGVSKVQLWGTRDGGQTWHFYAQDDDNRSPLHVTVDGEGLYGFRILVQSAASPGGFPPQAGDEPELWVGVDLQRPEAELLSVETGEGNLSDHLILRWRADDDNLEMRPISLLYSSRPAGPWSAVATGLENTGSYAWRLDRYVPTQLYLRLEVRDTAGNMSAYQTAEPVRLDRPEPSGSLRSVEPLGPSASTPLPSPR
jgi:hypothetical protein